MTAPPSPSDSPLTLASLLAPLTLPDFFAKHWEKSPLHLPRDDARYYASVLTERDLEQLISRGDLRFPALQLARHGGYFPPEAYTRTVKHGTELWSGVPDIDVVQREYAAGATLVLPALHRTWEPLRDLCVRLERGFSHAVHANAYLTAGNTTGFTPHYDTHEVFVLQVAGEKRWAVYAPPLPLPHRSQPFARAGYAPEAPLLEVILRPGDLLYLPRGYVHAAATTEKHSAHVTIGVTVYTWLELLSEWVQSARELPAFREALPVGFAQGTREDVVEMLKSGLLARVDALRTQTDAEPVVRAFQSRVRATQAGAPVTFEAARTASATAGSPRDP